jgi:hypothetical protein
LSKKCFFIAPIGDEETFVRRRSDQVFNHIIKPAAQECNYDDIIRSDLISEPGIITNQIIDRLFNDELVIADLTGNNVNVIYELALRHAFRKPAIQIKDSQDILPFDIQGTRTISFDYRFFDSVAKCKEDIVKQIKVIESDPNKIESPVAYIIDYHSLRKQDSDSKFILQLGSQVQTLTSELNDLKKRFSRQSADVSGLGLNFQLAPPMYMSGFSTLRKDDSIPPPPAPPPAPISGKKDEDKDKDK